MLERLQKVLSGAGVASRRDAEHFIQTGKVSVNGEIVRDLGRKVDPERDLIQVEGRAIPRNVPRLYVLLHKPKGYVTTREDPHAVNTVMDLVVPSLQARFGAESPAVSGLHPVGRLDAQTEGLLILTNDGAFTQAMTHPRHQVPKTYRATLRGQIRQDEVQRLREGIPLHGRRTLPAHVRVVRVDRSRDLSVIELTIREGRNQQVRRMLQAVGLPVQELHRVAVGPLRAGRLRPGQWRFLTPSEVEHLMSEAAASPEEIAAPPIPVRRLRPAGKAARSGRGGGRNTTSAAGARPPATGNRAGAGPSGGRPGVSGAGRPAGSRPASGPRGKTSGARTRKRG